MDSNDESLDKEFKKYLQIMRPMVAHLEDREVIEICNVWIQKLSSCNDRKALRNKYVFALCYQLANGKITDPFTTPPTDKLVPFTEAKDSSLDFTTESEYYLDLESDKTKILYNKERRVDDMLSERDSRKDVLSNSFGERSASVADMDRKNLNQSPLAYRCSSTTNLFANAIEDRATNLIIKLREIRQENVQLRNELRCYKTESGLGESHVELSDVSYNKIDQGTNAGNFCCQSLTALKRRLHEMQYAKDCLLEKLEYFEELTHQEIDRINNLHAAELKNKDDIILSYENQIKELQVKERDLIASKDQIIKEKEGKLAEKEEENKKLQNEVEKLKENIQELNKQLKDKQLNKNHNDDYKVKAEHLAKQLNKMEKAKYRYIKAFESKIAVFQREKHLTECSLQLQLIKQRSQVVQEAAEENQADLNEGLDKLENKYKDIVAKIQSTAIQRRIQDQLCLEAILNAAYGMKSKDNRNEVSEMLCSVLKNDNEVSQNDKSFGDGAYRLDGQELLRAYIPQRDPNHGREQ